MAAYDTELNLDGVRVDGCCTVVLVFPVFTANRETKRDVGGDALYDPSGKEGEARNATLTTQPITVLVVHVA